MQPLRLGSSTAGLSLSIPADILKTIRQNHEFSAEECEQTRKIAQAQGKLIAQSGIRSLEYFTTLPMLSLGLDHPMLDMFKGLASDQEVWSVHSPFSGVDLASPEEETRLRSVQDTLRAARLAGALGAKVLTVHPALELTNMETLRSTRLQASGQSIAEVADLCATLGVRVAVEILPRRCIGNSLAELFTILEVADRPNVGICLDTNHSFPASELTNVVRTLGSKLITLHVSDHDDVDERHWLPMCGLIDWPAFIRSIREIGYAGPFLYETPLVYPDFGDALGALEQNYAQLMESAAGA